MPRDDNGICLEPTISVTSSSMADPVEGSSSKEAPLSWRDLVDDVCEAQGNKYGQPKPGVLFCC